MLSFFHKNLVNIFLKSSQSNKNAKKYKFISKIFILRFKSYFLFIFFINDYLIIGIS